MLMRYLKIVSDSFMVESSEIPVSLADFWISEGVVAEIKAQEEGLQPHGWRV